MRQIRRTHTGFARSKLYKSQNFLEKKLECQSFIGERFFYISFHVYITKYKKPFFNETLILYKYIYIYIRFQNTFIKLKYFAFLYI